MIKEKTTFDKLLDKLRNHRGIAFVLVFCITVIALAKLVDAIGKLWSPISGLVLKEGEVYSIHGDLIAEAGVQTPSNIRVTIYWEKDDFPQEGFQSPAVVNVDPSTGRLNFDLTLDSPPPDIALLTIPPRGRFENNHGQLTQPIDEEMWDDVPSENIIELPPKEASSDYPESFFGVGIIIAFDDSNNNGIFDRDENLVGVCSDFAVAYVRGNLKYSIEWMADNLEFDTDMIESWPFLALPQGLSFVKVIPPAEDEGVFDMLVPHKIQRVQIILYYDHRNRRWPNWT